VDSYTIKLPFCLGPSLVITPILLLLNWIEEFNNLFNSNPMGSYLAIILLIKYTSALSVQKPSYKRNITKLKTIKAITEKGNKNIYIGYSN
jgi:SNF2 family DNA or RNA helicase